MVAGESADLVAVASIPAGAVAGETDVATLTVTAQGDNTKSATASLTTTTAVLKSLSYDIFPPLTIRSWDAVSREEDREIAGATSR